MVFEPSKALTSKVPKSGQQVLKKHEVRKVNHSAKDSSEDNDLTAPSTPGAVEGSGAGFLNPKFKLTRARNRLDKSSPGQNRLIWQWLGRGRVLLVYLHKASESDTLRLQGYSQPKALAA